MGPATGYGADDTFANCSNYGSVVDIAAPGVNILSTYTGQSYVALNGTSMAGAVALFLAGQSKLVDAVDVEFVREAIFSVGFPQNGGCGFMDDPDGIAEPVVNASPL